MNHNTHGQLQYKKALVKYEELVIKLYKEPEDGGVYNRWTGLLDWTTGLDYWTGLLDWTTGLPFHLAHAKL